MSYEPAIESEESILLSIRKLVGGDANGEYFDTDLIIQINQAFSTLTQLGAGPESGFIISSKEDLWTDFIPDDDLLLAFVKTYVYLKCRLVFDPPQNSFLVQLIQTEIKELEWRINISAESDTYY